MTTPKVPDRLNRTRHMVGMIIAKGVISPMCSAVPRAIDPRLETWTLTWDHVNCPECLLMMEVPCSG